LVNQDEIDSGERAGFTMAEEKEELRREAKTLRQEKEILRKAAVEFLRRAAEGVLRSR
jgi:transposase-like protein